MELEVEFWCSLKIAVRLVKLYQLLRLLVILDPEGEVVADNAVGAPAAEAAMQVERSCCMELNCSSNKTAPVVHEGGKNVRATPKARKVARELGIDVAQVPGTGAKVVFMLMTLRTLRVLNLRTPLARKTADLGSDLASVSGTSFGGKITKGRHRNQCPSPS